MIIGYRRLSGKIGITDNETGDRGTWLEKRRGLFGELRRRGHTIIPMSKPTKESASQAIFESIQLGYDLLMIEFGGTNKLYFGDDIAETVRIVKKHDTIPVVFMTDDPDLWFPWESFGNACQGKRTLWVNAVADKRNIACVGKVPDRIGIVDAPFASLVPMAQNASSPTVQAAAYIGRPDGRSEWLMACAAFTPMVKVYGRQKEWTKIPITLSGEPPSQKARAGFYAAHAACLAVYDKKHVTLGWRTGRAYHALAAGTPVINCGSNLAIKPWAHTATSRYDVEDQVKRFMDQGVREQVWSEQATIVKQDRAIMEEALRDSGL